MTIGNIVGLFVGHYLGTHVRSVTMSRITEYMPPHEVHRLHGDPGWLMWIVTVLIFIVVGIVVQTAVKHRSNTFFILRSTRFFLFVNFLVSVWFVNFWVTYSFGSDYRRFFRNYLTTVDGFLTSQGFLFVFQVVIYIGFIITSYLFLSSLLMRFKTKIRQ
jgi:hypothetical protein